MTELNITEMIPDDIPEWAIAAMAEGQLFTRVFQRIAELETENDEINDAKRILLDQTLAVIDILNSRNIAIEKCKQIAEVLGG